MGLRQRLGSSRGRLKDHTTSIDIPSNHITSPFNPSQLHHDDDTEKNILYGQLMDRLEAAEETHFTAVLVELLAFSGLLTALVLSLTMEWIKNRWFFHMRMWHYISLIMHLVSGLSVIRLATFLILWPVNRFWRTHKYVVYFSHQLKCCVDMTIWYIISLLSWKVLFQPSFRHVYGYISEIIAEQVTRFLIALCVGSFLWVLKNILYLKLEADLHHEKLFERVRSSVVDLHGLQLIHRRGKWRFLLGKKLKKNLIRMARRPHEVLASDVQLWMKGGDNIWMLVNKMEKESAPIWIIRRLMEEYLKQVKLFPLPGNSNVTMCDKTIILEAKKMFKQIIKNQLEENKPDLYSDLQIRRKDLEEESYGLKEEELNFLLKPNKQEEANDKENKAQASSSGMPTEGTICYEEFLKWTVRAYRNCWALEQTLISSKRVFIKLNRLLSTLVLVVVLIIWLLLTGIVDTSQLAILFAPFLGATFMFGESSRKMFDGLVFAFAMHPFNVGDRVIINNVQMWVTELNILTSRFHKYDTGEEVISPNSTLLGISITNLETTPDQGDKVEFFVDPQTPPEDLMDLEIKIKKFLDDDIEYSSNNTVVKSEIGRQEMKMTVCFKYLVAYLTTESKDVHKSKILDKIDKLRKDMGRKIKSKEQYSSSYQPFTVEIELSRNCKVNLKDIEDLQADMMRGIEERYKSCSKIVLVELTKSEVKMGLFVYYSDYAKEEKRSKKEGEPESEIRDHIESSVPMWIEKLQRNLQHTLKKKSFIKEARICQTNDCLN